MNRSTQFSRNVTTPAAKSLFEPLVAGTRTWPAAGRDARIRGDRDRETVQAPSRQMSFKYRSV